MKWWHYDEGRRKVYVEQADERDAIKKVRGVQAAAVYMTSRGRGIAWDFIVPDSLEPAVRKAVAKARRERVSNVVCSKTDSEKAAESALQDVM